MSIFKQHYLTDIDDKKKYFQQKMVQSAEHGMNLCAFAFCNESYAKYFIEYINNRGYEAHCINHLEKKQYNKYYRFDFSRIVAIAVSFDNNNFVSSHDEHFVLREQLETSYKSSRQKQLVLAFEKLEHNNIYETIFPATCIDEVVAKYKKEGCDLRLQYVQTEILLPNNFFIQAWTSIRNITAINEQLSKQENITISVIADNLFDIIKQKKEYYYVLADSEEGEILLEIANDIYEEGLSVYENMGYIYVERKH